MTNVATTVDDLLKNYGFLFVEHRTGGPTYWPDREGSYGMTQMQKMTAPEEQLIALALDLHIKQVKAAAEKQVRDAEHARDCFQLWQVARDRIAALAVRL